ncbi:expressed unknown protein [Seminavis robusta]|uniref:Uncharacterized protein n=1 Tax=Seminavis robusta TaxID=568900 RepID=A0A9N8EF51_9STRA|nr:expressed unknown protein [Seminavis robusta]|eukprot:Sro1061_g236840.1 n/a (90) ;mRNA; f:22619-23259
MNNGSLAASKPTLPDISGKSCNQNHGLRLHRLYALALSGASVSDGGCEVHRNQITTAMQRLSAVEKPKANTYEYHLQPSPSVFHHGGLF